MSQPAPDQSVLYQHSGRVPMASRLSYQVRQMMFARFMQVMQPTPEHRVLDIGVTNDTQFRESNYFEQWYPHKSQITCVGTENGQHLEALYPGIRFQQVVSGEKLPYADQSFDIAFSNAVLEHVGNSEAQAFFIKEACRVGKRVFITTPNRWFPIEPHTTVPLLHYLPKALYRAILRRTPLEFWSHEENLNLLTYNEFAGCFPAGHPLVTERIGIAAGPFRSNLIAWTKL